MIEACIFRWTSKSNGAPGGSEESRGVCESHGQNGEGGGFVIENLGLAICLQQMLISRGDESVTRTRKTKQITRIITSTE